MFNEIPYFILTTDSLQVMIQERMVPTIHDATDASIRYLLYCRVIHISE